MARLTLWGIYQYDHTLFDGIVLPDGINKDNLVSDIMRNSGDLYPYHQVPEYLKQNINFWFARRHFDFERMYEALRAEYSPIENYDRIEDIKREYKDTGTDSGILTLGSSTTVAQTGTDTETTTLGSSTTLKHTGTDTDTMQGGGSTEKGVSAYNETGYTNREKDTETQNSTNSKQYNSTETNTGSGSDEKEQTYNSTVTNTASGSDEKKQTYDSTVTNTGSGSDEKKQTYDSTVTNTESGSDEKKQTYDSTVINTGSGSDKTQTEYEKQRTETENTRVHGNIGVTTSQQMIESEMSLRAKYDIYKIISREFEREFLVQIY